MAGMKVLLAICLVSSVQSISIQRASAGHAANPIRKVVTMLQNMQAKVTAEGKKDKELYDKFMCWCQTSGSSLDGSINAASSKIESLSEASKSAKAKKEQTEADLSKHQGARAEAKDAMAKATAVRNKENAAYKKESSDLSANTAALAKAITAIENGMGGFLQTTAAQRVRNIAMEQANMLDSSRQEILAFLSGEHGVGYAPASGEIVGILKQMKDEMDGSLADATAAETEAATTFGGLIQAKKKEVASLTKQIEVELERVGNLGVEIASMDNDIEDTQEALAADQAFKADTAKACATKEAEYAEVKKTRAEELLALAETIKVLNDDDALELFKKTLPSAASSFLQLKENSLSLKAKATAILNGARRAGVAQPELDLISLAINGKKIGFGKVIKMIDSMVANLKKEQQDDNSKKEYCNTQFDLSDDKKKMLENSITDSETTIEECKGGITEATAEIGALEAGIAALDKTVAEATEQRQADNAEFKDLVANNAAAKEIILWAKNRLNKFYNPKLYKAPAKRELSEEDRIVENMAFVQTSARRHIAAPPPPPETFGAYQKKSESGTGVIAMIDLLVADLDKETTEGKTEEADAQADYEKAMQEAAKKRAQDSKSLTDKAAAKASMEQALQEETENKASTSAELAATLKYIHSLHGECDWLLKYYDVRSEARSSEIDALGKAKDVLNGASFSMF